MSLVRILPCLDVQGGRVVKGVQFRDLVDAGDPAALGRAYRDEGADELVFLDISASADRRRTRTEWVARVAEELDIPFTVGGGISDPAQARALVALGADKVSLNTAAVRDPDLLGACARLLGRQAVVLAVDLRQTRPGAWEVVVEGGRTPTGLDALDWIRRGVSAGAGEVLLTSMDRDGTTEGYDLPLLRAVREAVSVPLVASGGAGTKEHFLEGARAGADGLLAASVFHYRRIPLADLKDYLGAHGVAVRPAGKGERS